MLEDEKIHVGEESPLMRSYAEGGFLSIKESFYY